jgi:hypothetical protein
VLASLLFVWGLVELPALLNIIDYEALELNGVWGNLHFVRVADPQLTHIEPAYAHYRGAAYGGDAEVIYQIPASDRTLFRWDLKYDRNGFRNDVDLNRADIAVIGDSMVEGMTVSNVELATSVLQRLQGKTVANLGQYGYGPQQELIVLKRYGLALQPRTVIWVFFEGNDLQDAIGYRQIALHPPTFWNFLLQRSFTRVSYRAVKRLFAKPRPAGVTRSGVIQSSNGIATRMYFTYPAQTLTEELQGAVGETVGIIAAAHHLADAQRSRLVFVFAPDKFRVLHDLCQFPDESECRQWTVNNLPDLLRKQLALVSTDIGYLDLTPYLIDASRHGALPYYSDDIHWSPPGHRVAAEAINNYLSSAEPREGVRQ